MPGPGLALGLAAAARGIAVVYTPAASTQSVAAHTIGLMLAALRRFPEGAAAVRGTGFHAFRGSARFLEMGDATLGVVGMGRIGSAVARIAAVA